MKVDVVSGVNGKERRQALACLNKGGTADADWSLVRKLAGAFIISINRKAVLSAEDIFEKEIENG